MEETAGVGFAFAFVAFYFLFIGTAMLCGIASWVVTILAVWACARRDFPDPGTRALWCVLIVMTRWLGALIYYIAIYRANDPPVQRRQLAQQAPQQAG